MSERYFKSPRVNVRDRAREFEAKQANVAVTKTVSTSASSSRRPSATPKLLKENDATGTSLSSSSTSLVVDDIKKNEQAEGSSASNGKSDADRCENQVEETIKEEVKKEECVETKVKVIKREKNSGAKKKVSSKLKDSSSTSTQDCTEIPVPKKKVGTGTTTKNNHQLCAGEQPPCVKSAENDPGNGGQTSKGIVEEVVDTLATDKTYTTHQIEENRKLVDEPHDVIPVKNTEELVKQFNKLSSSQLEVLHKKSCSLDSGLSEITNWVNEEENDTSDDERVKGDSKSNVTGAKFRKLRKNFVKKQRNVDSINDDKIKPNQCSKKENLETGRDKCVTNTNKNDDSTQSGSQVTSSPQLNQRSTSYLRYLQKITQLQHQQQKNIEAENLQQLVKENYNVYNQLNDSTKRDSDFSPYPNNFKGCNVENVDKDNLEGGINEDKKQRTKLGRVEINSNNNNNNNGCCSCSSSSSSEIEKKKNLDECLCGKIANSKSVVATSFSNSLSGDETKSKNSFTSSETDQLVVKRDGSTSVAKPSILTSTLAPKSHYLSSSSSFSCSTSTSSPVAVTPTVTNKQDVGEENELGKDVEDEDSAAVDTKFRISMLPSQNKWKARQYQSKTKQKQQQQLTSTTLLNLVEHRHKQVDSTFQPKEEEEEEEEEEEKQKTSVGVNSVSRPGTKEEDETPSSYQQQANNWGNAYYSAHRLNESSQIAELLTSVRKIKEEFERCSLEVEQEVEEEEEKEKEKEGQRKRKEYFSNNECVGNLSLSNLTANHHHHKCSNKFMDKLNSGSSENVNLPPANDTPTKVGYNFKDGDERVKKSWISKNCSSSSSPSTTNKNSTIAQSQHFGFPSKFANDCFVDENGDKDFSSSLKQFYSPKDDFYHNRSLPNGASKVLGVNPKRSCVDGGGKLSSENHSQLTSKLTDDGKRMERRNSPGDARFSNDNSSASRVQPVSPLNLQHFDVSVNYPTASSFASTNGVGSCPNSPRSILTNKSTSSSLPAQQQFNYSNFNNSNNNNNNSNQLFSSITSPKSKGKIQVRAKPELPAYFTFRRRPALRKVSSDPHHYESGAVSDGEKRELEKIESILGELDFSKYKRGSAYSRQSNSQEQQQQQTSPSLSQLNYSLVPIRVPRRSLSHQTSKSHQEKLRELRELTEKLKPTLNKAKLDSSGSSSSSSATNSPYPSYFYPTANTIDALTELKSQSLPRRSHLPVFRSASVPQVDDFDDQDSINQINNQNSYYLHQDLHKAFSSSEYIPVETNNSPSSIKLFSPLPQTNLKANTKNRLNVIGTFATLPRILRRGLKMDNNKSDQVADLGGDSWGSQSRLQGDEDEEVVRRVPVDSSTDEGLVADLEAVSDYMQTYRNVTSSFSAPSTPVTRHRVTTPASTTSTVDRFDLQVEAAIAELQATTSGNNYANTTLNLEHGTMNKDLLHYNSLDRRKRRKGAGLAVGFSTSIGGANEGTAKSGNGRSLTYPPQRRTSVTEGMEFTSVDSNGIPSYLPTNSILNLDVKSSGIHNAADSNSANRHGYNLQVAEDVANFPSELSLADSHLCPSEINYEATYNDVLESVTAEPNGVNLSLNENGNSKPLKKKHYSDPSGEKNNEGLLLDLPEFISCAKSEPQLPSNKKSEVGKEERLSRSRQSYNSMISQHPISAVLTRSTSFSPAALDNPSANNPSSGRNTANNSASDVNLDRNDSKSPQQQRRYSKKRLRGPYGEMLEEEMRKSGEKHSQKVIAEELSFLQELMENRPSGSVTDGCSAVEPHHSRHHLSSQSLDENALRSNSAVLDLYNQSSVSGSSDDGGAYTSFVPTLLDNRMKEEGTWNLCESLDAEGEDLESLLKRNQDTRTHVVAELYDTEKSYVESLQILVNKYFRPLKSPEYSGLVDSHLVEEMFFQIPEILNHHEVFLEVLKQRLENWDNKQKVGDVFVESFTRQPVIDTYTAFINNWKSAKEAIKIATQAKPAFAKFLEHMSREHKGKLTLDALLIMPVQRIPRYELLIKELLKHTQLDHPDHRLLVTAQKEVHDLAVKINHMEREAHEAEQMQLKLREMESLIEGLIDLVHPMRTFIRYDLVTMSGSLGAKKERCLFLFSDLLVIASIKKKSGPMRKTASLGSPGSLSYLMEMNKYKLLMKISLDDLDIARSNDTNIKKILKDIEQLEGDMSLLNQINDLSVGLVCPHQNLDEVVKEMLSSITKLLQERQTSDSQLLCLDLTVTTQVGVETMSIIFGAPDKRAFWEAAFHEAKQKLALSTDRRPPPEFLYPLPIRKTRAGLQFTCAAPTLGLNAHNLRDVWVCNSDGYVGQVCVLSLQPEPTVTSCNGVCNSRILCIASIPAAAPGAENFTSRRRSAFLENKSGISISIEDVDEEETCSGNGNIQLDSDSSEEEKEPLSESQDEEYDRKKRGESPSEDAKIEDVDNQSPTMWLGTEDGCIHVYNCNDNIRIKKNKIKLQHPAVIHCIIHMDNKVFVSLANGDVAVYHRDPAGGWNTYEPTTISIGTAAAPVTRMLPVLSKLWCGCHNVVKIVCTTSLEIEHSFPAHLDNNRPIQCMVNSGLGVWTSVQNSSIIKLFHATSYETLLEVNVAPAVSKMLAANFGKYSSAGCDDIIRQHKTACLRVTSLLACKDLLWIGTSAGVVLNLLLPHLSSTTTKLASIPNVSGIPYGHTGHVRFLTCVEMTSLQEGLRRGKYTHRSTIKYRDGHGVGRRASTSALGSNRLLVISGGDGYEDFRNTNFSEAAGRDDSTNHLLLWQV